MIRIALTRLARRALAARWTFLDVFALAALTFATQFFFPAYDVFDAVEHVAPDTLQSARLAQWGAERRAEGEVPLWNPYVYGGFPIHASGIGAFYYPGSAAYTRGDLLDVLRIDFGVHLFIAALGVYVLARGLCRNRTAALLAAAAAVFAAPGTLLLDGHPITSVHAFAFAPWALCGARLATSTGRPLGGLIAAAALGLQALTGAIPLFMATCVIVIAFIVMDAFRRYFVDWEPLRPVAGRSTIAALGVVLGAVLGAVQLLPSAEYFSFEWRETTPTDRERYDVAASVNVISEYSHDIVPALPSGAAPASAPNTIVIGGLFLLSLAAFGVVRAPGREKWVLAALVLLGYGFIAGEHVWIYRRLYRLPFFDPEWTVREVAAVTGLVIATLAGLGADVLLERRETVRAGAIGVWPLWLLLAASMGWMVWDQYESLGVAAWILIAVSGLGVALVFVRGRGRILVAGWLLACLAIDISPGVEAAPRLPDTAAAFPTYGPSGEFVPVAKQKSDAYRMALLPAADAPVRGYHAFEGIFTEERTLPMFDRHFPGSLGRSWWEGAETVRRLWQLSETEYERQNVELRRIQQGIAFLSALNVEYVFAPSPGPLFINRMVDAGGVFKKFDLVHATIYQADDTMPVAYILHETRVREDRKSFFSSVLDAEFDSRRIALIEAPMDDSGFAPGTTEEGIRVERYEDHEVELTLFVDAPGILVLTDSFYPGWIARFGDGSVRDVVRVNEFLRGVRVQPGDERVVFGYEPPWTDAGLALSARAAQVWAALAVLCAGVWAVTNIRRSRQQATVA